MNFTYLTKKISRRTSPISSVLGYPLLFIHEMCHAYSALILARSHPSFIILTFNETKAEVSYDIDETKHKSIIAIALSPILGFFICLGLCIVEPWALLYFIPYGFILLPSYQDMRTAKRRGLPDRVYKSIVFIIDKTRALSRFVLYPLTIFDSWLVTTCK